MSDDGRIELLHAELRSRGERMTVARKAIIDVLADASDHLTAEDVLEAVQAKHPEIHRATVYRTLDRFTELGITEHTHLGHGPAVYHLTDNLHQHLVCEHCGRVTEVPTSVFRSVQRRLQDDYGFVMRPLHFAIVGQCQRCSHARQSG
jgi:Fe2+ or Zn2+ uptake regulation protein